MEDGRVQYDTAIIGAGPAGYTAAIRAAQLGMKTVLIDRREMPGGTCLNIGCIPSKALLDSSGLFAKAGHGFSVHGIVIKDPELDLTAMMKRKDDVVARLTGGVKSLLKSNGVQYIHGSARITSPGRISVGKAGKLEAEHIIIATGSRPVELPVLPFDGERIISSTEALSPAEVPEEITVVGGGAVGLELGSVWLHLGSRVRVIEMMEDILPGWDIHLRRGLRKSLEKEGMRFELSTRITESSAEKEGLKLTLERKDGGNEKISTPLVLAAAGRRPAFEGTGIEELGIKTTGRGAIKVDERFRTDVAGIYAVGDVIGGPMLAHKAEEEGIAAVELIAGRSAEVNYRCIPAVVYTHPEAAAAGLTEEELKEKDIPYRSGRFPFSANGRALAAAAPEGFVKILCRKDTDAVLGVAILGPSASDLIAEAVTVMEFGGSGEDIARTVHAHPTFAEALREAALSADDRAIHINNRQRK